MNETLFVTSHMGGGDSFFSFSYSTIILIEYKISGKAKRGLK